MKDFQLKMENMTLLTANNNFHTLATSLEELQQEINAEKGKDFCKEDKLLTKLFCTAEVTTNKLFAINISLAKTAWITGKVTNNNIIMKNLCVLCCNSNADGIWSKVSSADSKIIALTTQVNSLKVQLKNNSNTKSPNKAVKPGAKPTGKGNMEPSNTWQYTKVGKTTKDPVTGTTVKWSPHHGIGAYIPYYHNHSKWLEKRKKCSAKWAEGGANKCLKFSDKTKAKRNVKPAVTKDKKHPTKLQSPHPSVSCWSSTAQ